MKAKLTDTGIRSYQPRAVQYSIGDAACPGLCIRITPKGVKTFAFAYRNKGTGKVAWLTLGRYPDVPLAQARELANDARKTVAVGGTPLNAQGPARRGSKKKLRPTPSVVELYYDAQLTALAPVTSHAHDAAAHRAGLRLERSAGGLDHRRRCGRHAAPTSRSGAARRSMANQTKHIIHAMFKWAKQPGRKFVTVNPFADLPAPGGAKVARDRFLTAAEIRQVWRALDEPEALGVSARCGDRAAPDPRDGGAARHGARHGRHRTARPARAERARSTLVSACRAHEGWQRVHHAALRLRAGTAAAASQGRSGRADVRSSPRYHLHEAAQRLVAGLAMERWTPHDLRRTAATILDREGYSLEQIGAMLAHTRKGVTAVYARWDKFGLRREMATVVERSLRETLAEHPEAAIAA